MSTIRMEMWKKNKIEKNKEKFRAQWQNEQLSSLRENLLPNHCVVIHDYSENYGCKEKFELQQTYF
jgi:hypothetical protein